LLVHIAEMYPLYSPKMTFYGWKHAGLGKVLIKCCLNSIWVHVSVFIWYSDIGARILPSKIITDVLCTNFNVLNISPIMFLYMFWWCSLNLSGWPRQTEICRSYDKLCLKNMNLTLVHLLVCLCELFINAQPWLKLTIWRFRHRWKVNIKMDFRSRMGVPRLDWSGSRQGQVTDACKCSEEISGSIKCGKILG